ncbi:MAG TPA: hypothetical protein VMX13_10745 [Sedimentisphaerales bacterium]|nr:hypothetical protein [Sedimentisphaerales bacterium]
MKPQLFRNALYLLLLCILPVSVTEAKTAERFLYRHISDVITLDAAQQELDYRFWFEDWDIGGWDTRVIRNELTYRRGFSDRLEVGVDAMYSSVCYVGWGSTSVFNDTDLYAKYQVISEEDQPVTFAVGGRLFAPTGKESRGFGVGEWYSGGFLALSKKIDPWRIGASFGRTYIDETGWRSYNNWQVGARSDFGLNLELVGSEAARPGSDHRLLGVVGVWWPTEGLDAVSQLGLLIPMDGSDMNLGVIFSIGVTF